MAVINMMVQLHSSAQILVDFAHVLSAGSEHVTGDVVAFSSLVSAYGTENSHKVPAIVRHNVLLRPPHFLPAVRQPDVTLVFVADPFSVHEVLSASLSPHFTVAVSFPLFPALRALFQRFFYPESWS